MILTRDRAFLSRPDVRLALSDDARDSPMELLWTDKYASLWQVVMF